MTAQAGGASLFPGHGDSDAAFGGDHDKVALRRRMRLMRKALPYEQRAVYARAIANHIARRHLLRPGQRVGVYLAHGAEVSLDPLIRYALQIGCRLYAPRLTNVRRGVMRFHSLHLTGPLSRNRFGIAEPLVNTPFIAAQDLDVVFTPLLAVDRTGRRLGSGAGYYDRLFARRRWVREWRKPRLIGVAYSFQCIDALAADPWDVPLDELVTEASLLRFSAGSRPS